MYIGVKRGVWINVFAYKRNLENANRQDFKLPIRGHHDWCVVQGNPGLRNLPAKTNFSFQNTSKEFFKGRKKKEVWFKTRAALISMILISITHLTLGTRVPFSYPRDKGKLRLHLDPAVRG